jgi:hypothetical protein
MSEERRLGKRPPKVDRRTLRFAKYRTRELPVPPLTEDHYSRIASWPVLSNTKYGDCVLAGSAHMIQDWTAYASTERCPSEQEVVDLYLQLSPNDEGLYILDTLNLWRQSGLWGDIIEAFVLLDRGDVGQAKQAIHLFGAIKIGMSLPDQNTFGPWERVQGPPNPSNGHDVALVGYDATGFWVVTWGTLIHMSYAWFTKYTDEAYAVLSKDWLNSVGESDDGFDFATLWDDLAALTGEPPGPPVDPPSPPSSWVSFAFIVGAIAVIGFLIWRFVS